LVKRNRKRTIKRTIRRVKRVASRKRVGKSIQSNWKKISVGAGALAFLSNITSSDMAASTGQPIGVRAMNFGNSLFGRISGFTPFKNAPGANIPQTIGIENIFNKWSGIGAASFIYGLLPVKQLPHKSKAKTLGKSLLSAGILSGLFMPGSGNPHNTNLLTSRPALTVSSSQVSYT